MVKKILFSLVVFCISIPVFARVKIQSGYHLEDFNFATNAHGANLLLFYDKEKSFGVRGGFRYLDKFGDQAPGYLLGGTYFFTPQAVLTLDLDLAPNQIVIPRQGYTLELSQTIFKTLVPAVGFRFADYQDVNAYTFQPSLTWYFYPRFYGLAKYFLTITELPGGNETANHSVMAKVNWNPIDPLDLSAGYSRANESFDSGNPVSAVGSFSANHVFGGLKWKVFKGFGVDFVFDYERRNNGFTVKTFDTALFYEWP